MGGIYENENKNAGVSGKIEHNGKTLGVGSANTSSEKSSAPFNNVKGKAQYLLKKKNAHAETTEEVLEDSGVLKHLHQEVLAFKGLQNVGSKQSGSAATIGYNLGSTSVKNIVESVSKKEHKVQLASNNLEEVVASLVEAVDAARL
ncbi:hypothetical protein ACOSP7_003737 [Xanthoceras sorbifolium]